MDVISESVRLSPTNDKKKKKNYSVRLATEGISHFFNLREPTAAASSQKDDSKQVAAIHFLSLLSSYSSCLI